MHYAGAIIGPPRVGKSTALNLANLTCGISEGEYAGKTLFNPDLEGKRTRYMQNKKRIVCIDELPVAALRNEETVKNMMAHSGVEMRGMMKDEELDNRWKPKIFMAMNEKPEYKDTSGAIKERIVPLMVRDTRPKEERDLFLLKKMKPELGGFAASCIRLAMAALNRGYYPLSGAMKQVINEMEVANNPLKSFVQDKCVLDPNGFVFTDALHTLYTAHCKDALNIPLAKYKMSSELTQMGKGIIQKKKRNPDNGYSVERGLAGIRLRTGEDPQTEDDAFEDGDPILNVDDVDDMLTTLFERRQHPKGAPEAGLDTNVDDVDDISPINAYRDKENHLNTTGKECKSNSIESNSAQMSSTSSTYPMNEPGKLLQSVDDTSNTSSTPRQRRQHTETPANLIDEMLTLGKKIGYPDAPELGLGYGLLQWNSFVNSRRIAIPAVLTRFTNQER